MLHYRLLALDQPLPHFSIRQISYHAMAWIYRVTKVEHTTVHLGNWSKAGVWVGRNRCALDERIEPTPPLGEGRFACEALLARPKHSRQRLGRSGDSRRCLQPTHAPPTRAETPEAAVGLWTCRPAAALTAGCRVQPQRQKPPFGGLHFSLFSLICDALLEEAVGVIRLRVTGSVLRGDARGQHVDCRKSGFGCRRTAPSSAAGGPARPGLTSEWISRYTWLSGAAAMSPDVDHGCLRRGERHPTRLHAY